jgi:hypothetical protein
MSAGAAPPMAPTGGGWMGGADGRTPAAREAMRLTKRAMVETGAGGGLSPGRDGQFLNPKTCALNPSP